MLGFTEKVEYTGWLKLKYPTGQMLFLDNQRSCYNSENLKKIILVFSKVMAV